MYIFIIYIYVDIYVYSHSHVYILRGVLPSRNLKIVRGETRDTAEHTTEKDPPTRPVRNRQPSLDKYAIRC